MLGKMSRNFGNFSLLGNVDFFHICPKHWAFSKIPMLEFFWHFGNFYSAQ
jgi:hypothetical protein